MAGIVSRVIKAIRVELANGDKVTDVQANTSANANLTPHLYLGPGEDSLPLPDDFCMLIPTKQSGVYSVVGFLDPQANQFAQPGEKRVYSRDEDGNETASIWLKQSGDIVAENEKCLFELLSDGSIALKNKSGESDLGLITMNGTTGSISLNGVVIDSEGNISNITSVTSNGEVTAQAGANSVKLSTHVHTGNLGAPTTPPTPGT